MNGRRRDGGIGRAAAGGRARAMLPWLRRVRAWLAMLGYRPERRYMRGAPKAAATFPQA